MNSVPAAFPASPLEVSGLDLAVGGRVLLQRLDVRLAAGEVLAITGPSGCGKSCLMRALAGLDRPASGSVRRDGHVAVAFQDPGLAGSLTGLQAIRSGRLRMLPWWRGWRDLPDDADAPQRAEQLGVAHLLDRPVSTASGGQRQRLAIARALHHGGPAVLLDEPVSQLDQQTASRVLLQLRAEASAGRRGIAIVIHQPELVAGYADRELRLDGGGSWSLHGITR